MTYRTLLRLLNRHGSWPEGQRSRSRRRLALLLGVRDLKQANAEAGFIMDMRRGVHQLEADGEAAFYAARERLAGEQCDFVAHVMIGMESAIDTVGGN
jgi:hypothetical protein